MPVELLLHGRRGGPSSALPTHGGRRVGRSCSVSLSVPFLIFGWFLVPFPAGHSPGAFHIFMFCWVILLFSFRTSCVD